MYRLSGFTFLLLSFLLLLSCGNISPQDSTYGYLYKDLPFEMPLLSPPSFPDYSVSIVDFGGRGDGTFLNSDAFASAISHLSSRGGGRLIVPAGVWFTGPIVLQSNINLHLEDRSIILFSPDKDLYPLVETSFEGLDTRRCQSPIWGKNLQNIAITGSGAIDGNGHYWRPLKKDKVTDRQWERMTAGGGVYKRADYWMPSAAYLHGDTTSDMNVPRNLKSEEEWLALRDFLRPVMVSLQNCKDVFLQGVIFQNSAAWNIHPLMCENVIIDGIQVRNPSYAQNGDGIDLESCKNSIIVNSSFDVGDDGICVKSGKGEDGRKRNMPTENLIVDNCTVFKGHGGFVVGSEMSGGVKNVSVSNCQFLGTDVGLRFKSSRGRGGVVENIYISNVSMFDIATEPVLFNLYYGGKSAVESLEEGDEIKLGTSIPQVDETTPLFRNIYIEGITCRNARRALYFHGLPEQNIENIHISDFVVHAQVGGELIEADHITLKNVAIYPETGAAIKLHNVGNLQVEGLQTGEQTEVIYEIRGNRTRKIVLDTVSGSDKVYVAGEVGEEQISFLKK
ncbi:MAG: glycoside hydrolase [Bacteroidetes bacterium GWD2_45_23]|nr:MAG: glycoside hydrolase [Bacteroidetes bacterium GWC2_46_850]OFX72597.1 MAG: glycoside hydrolase [Bacteroidetes bacterium GWC1_47_7]OFX87565.1 MAG: glycoside hydrolase [Bacteroidetes bacterium GWD2_45_23]HAR37948.1 glycoside hydrolase [Porphyromonadaceae bacterium]HBB01483.1 glycoside hydrolase [Porphyromonadaceae bacterium]